MATSMARRAAEGAAIEPAVEAAGYMATSVARRAAEGAA